MEGMASSIFKIALLIGVLVLQYFLAKRPQKWLAFILPAVFFLLSIGDVVQTVQSGTVIYAGIFGTAAMTFLANNIITAMLLMVWWKKDFDKGTIAIAVFAVYILSNVIMVVCLILTGLVVNLVTPGTTQQVEQVGILCVTENMEDKCLYVSDIC